MNNDIALFVLGVRVRVNPRRITAYPHRHSGIPKGGQAHTKLLTQLAASSVVVAWLIETVLDEPQQVRRKIRPRRISQCIQPPPQMEYRRGDRQLILILINAKPAQLVGCIPLLDEPSKCAAK